MMASEGVLSHYWGLASTNEDQRLTAACGLLNSLIEAQNEHVNKGNNESLCDDLDYSLKRLSKGLASSRKGARQGFATALTEIVHQFECVEREQVMELLEKNLHVTGSVKSQEERNSYIGHIFGLMSVVKSYDLNDKTEASECSWLAKVVSTLKELSEKKSYIKEICMKAIVDITAMISFEVFKEHILPSVNECIFSGWPKATPESLLVALYIQRRFESEMDKKLFKKAWGTKSIVNSQNYSKLSNVLQDTTNALPNVHCVWDEVFLQIFDQEKSLDFQQFWNKVIDDGLFTSSHGKKYLGFTLIAKMLPKLKEDQVSLVFSRNIVKSLLNNLLSPQNYLHNAAKHLASSMPNGLSENEDPNVTAAVIQQMLGKNGNIQFDQLTKTKTVESLLGKLQGSGLERVVVWLIDCFMAGYTTLGTEEERPSEREVDFIRLSILNQILSLGKNKNLCQSGEWMKKLLFFLIETSYFEKEKDKLLFPLSKQVKEVSEQRLLSFIKELGTLSHSAHNKRSNNKKPEKGSEEQNWMLIILTYIKELLESDNYKVATPSWSSKTQKSFDNALKVITKIHKKRQDGTSTPEDDAFELLLSHMTLQLFMEPEQTMEILDEVKSCYKNRQENEKPADTDEPHWVEVLTEILLSLLTRPSNLLRHVVDEVFTAIASHLTQDALGIILQAVDPKSLGEGKDEVLQVEESDDEDMDDEDEEESKGSGSGSDQDDEDDDDDDDDESEGEDGNEVDEAFRADVRAALGNAAVPDDEEGSDEDDFDDEAMQQFDEALASVFRTRTQVSLDKKKKKDKSKTILHFKLRVLDIIEIFIKKQQSNPLILDLVEPLLSLVWSTINSKDYATLGERAQGIYRNKLCTIREQPSTSDVSSDELHDLLETLINKSMLAPSLNIVTLVTKGCMLLIRVLKGKQAQVQSGTPSKKRKHKDGSTAEETVGLLDVPRVAGFFKLALKDFMEKRTSHLHPVLFTELINRYQFLAWELAPELATTMNTAVNNFRKMQACAMLSKLLSHKCASYEQHIKSLAPVLQETLQSVLEESSQESTTMKAKHLKELIKLMTKFLKEMKNLEAEHVIQKELLTKALQKCHDGILATRSQDIKSSCVRLIAAIENSSKHDEPKSSKTKKLKKETHSNGHIDAQSSDTVKHKHKNKHEKT